MVRAMRNANSNDVGAIGEQTVKTLLVSGTCELGDQ